jgi:Xaa-Pro aminopeptidase
MLQDIGIVKSGVSMEALTAADIDKIFMPHGLGHFLGLDVHDPSDQGMVPKKPLQPGYVITVEPGM